MGLVHVPRSMLDSRVAARGLSPTIHIIYNLKTEIRNHNALSQRHRPDDGRCAMEQGAVWGAPFELCAMNTVTEISRRHVGQSHNTHCHKLQPVRIPAGA